MKNVQLNIPTEKHKYLMKTLESFKAGLRVLGINQLYKQSLLKDVYTIESILKTNKQESV